MKKIGLFLFLICSLQTNAAKPVVIKANDPNIDYVGRVQKSTDGSVSFDWSGVYLRTHFSGTSIAMRAVDTKYSEYNIFIDGYQVGKADIKRTDTLITLASGLEPNLHSLMLQKRTEGMEGRTTIFSFQLDKGSHFFPIYDRPSRLIEFVGNSITCGYGTENNDINHPYDPRTQNSYHTYCAIIARYFDADYMLTSHSGNGIIKNWDDTVTQSKVNMLVRYSRLFDEYEEPWDFSVHPSMVCISLGTNDFSQEPRPTENEFSGAYRKLFALIREKHGNIPILCIAPLAGEPSHSYMKRLVEQSGDEHIYYMCLYENMMDEGPDLGPSYHPTYIGHQKMAMTIIPYISKIMKWNLTENPIK